MPNRSLLLLTVLGLSLLLSSCTDPQTKKKLEDMEQRIAALEGKAPAGPAGKAPQALKPVDPAGDANEQGARTLLAEAQNLLNQGKKAEALAKLDECSAKYGTARSAARCKSMRQETALIGSKATGMAVSNWVQGKAKLGQGKDTLLVFWEVWCPHCKREVPKLEGIYTSHKGKGLQVVGLTKMTRGITEEKVKAFLSENKVSYPIAVEDQGKMSQEFSVRGIPAAAFVNEKGVILWRGHPAQLTDEKLAELMKG